MTLALQRFANGDTNYIAKHNSNADALETAINGLAQAMSGSFGAAISIGAALEALLGSSTALIGSGSYTPTGSGTTLTVTGGYAWRPDLGVVVHSVANVALSFSGQTAGTYYVVPDATGAPTRGTSATGAVYSVVWTGSAFGAITRMAPVIWGAADEIAAQTSTALGASYIKLDDRLEAGEAKAVAGDLARTAQKGKTTKSVAGGANVTLTAAESNAAVIEATGTLTADITLTLDSSGPRTWLLVNSTTGGRSVTAKVGSGASVKLPPGSTFVYWNGSDLISAGFRPYRPAIMSITYAASMTADFAAADTVRATLYGNPGITLAGGTDGRKLILELTQDSAGGRTPTFGAEVRYGADITGIALSTATGKTDRLGFIYDAAAGKYDLVAITRGYGP